MILKLLKLIALEMIFPHLFLSCLSLALLISNSPSTTKRLSFVSEEVTLSTLFIMQWAAVTTHLAAIRVPPQVVWFLPIISNVQLVDNLWKEALMDPVHKRGSSKSFCDYHDFHHSVHRIGDQGDQAHKALQSKDIFRSKKNASKKWQKLTHWMR